MSWPIEAMACPGFSVFPESVGAVPLPAAPEAVDCASEKAE
jgi:hypothetical protein